MKCIMNLLYIFLLSCMQLSIFASENLLHKTQEEHVGHKEKIELYTLCKKNHIKESVYKVSKKRSYNVIQSAEEYKNFYMKMFDAKHFHILQKQDASCDNDSSKELYDFDEIFNPELIQKYDDAQNLA